MSEGSTGIHIEPPFKKMEQKIILDMRTFVPCHAKEVEEWTWGKMKNEKWIVHLQTNGMLKKWKITN